MSPTNPLGPLTAAQQAAVAKLACTVSGGDGAALLCGPAGVGKTTVLEHLARSVGGAVAGPIGIGELTAIVSQESAPNLPRLLLADDSQAATVHDLVTLVDHCRMRRPGAGIVLAGQGRLLTLIAREQRLQRAIGMRVVLEPFAFGDSLALVRRRLAVDAGEVPSDCLGAVARTIHEIAGGIPADVVRLTNLAALVAEARPEQPLTPADIEAIHRRLDLRAA